MSFHAPKHYMVNHPKLGMGDGNNGCFRFSYGGDLFTVIASDGAGWEHVSVSLTYRTPKWTEMCYIKNLFWDDEDCVVQYHPPRSDYVNNHPYCLHLWRQINKDFPIPPSILVGISPSTSQSRGWQANADMITDQMKQLTEKETK